MTTDLQDLVSRGTEPRYRTELLRDVDAAATSIPVLTTAGRPATGKIVVDNERIAYASLTPTSFEGCTRGDGQDEGFSEPRAHVGGAIVENANRPNFERAAADVIAGMQDDIATLQAAQISVLPDHADFAFKFGSTGNGNSQFKICRHCRVDPSGNIYVVDAQAGQYKKFTAAGAFVFKTSLGGRLSAPIGLAVGADDTVWILDTSYLYQSDTFGNYWARYSLSSLGVTFATYLCLDEASGKVWLNDVAGSQLIRFVRTTGAADLTVSYTNGGSGTGGDFVGNAGAIAIDPVTGYLHVADIAGKQFQIYNPAGATWVGTWGGGGGSHFGYSGGQGIFDLTFDTLHNWRWAVDDVNLNIQVYDDTGVYKFSFGGGGGGDGQFTFISAADARLGNSVVASDSTANRVQKFTIANATGGAGDFSTTVSSSSAGQLVQAAGTTGKTGNFYTGTGLVKTSGGVASAAVANADYLPATSGAAIQKANGSGGLTAAVAKTDYAPPTSGTAIQKGDGAGGFAAAVAKTDYAPPTTGSSSLKGDGAGGFANATLNDNGAPTADFSMNSHKLTSVADPASAQDAATKNYVDGALFTLDWKNSVKCATVVTGSYTFATSFANGQTVDGITLATGDRILIKDMGTASQNGIYVVQASGSPVRATDADAATEVSAGMTVYVEQGTVNAQTVWVQTTTGAITLGTTSLNFAILTPPAHNHTSATTGNTLTFAAHTDVVISSPANNQVLAYNSGLGVWANVSPSSLPSAPSDTMTAYQQLEDFTSGGTSDGNIGQLGWNTSGNGSISKQADALGHPGIIQIASGGTSGNATRLYYGGWQGDSIKLASIYFQINGLTTSCVYRLGLFDNLLTPTVGVGLEFDTSAGDTALMNVKYVSSTRTASSSGLAPASGTGWYRLDLTWTGAGAWTIQVFRIDSGNTATGTATNITAMTNNTPFYLGASAKTLNGTAKQLWLDGALIQTQNIGRN